MGAWSVGIFGDDDALDWVGFFSEYSEGKKRQFIFETVLKAWLVPYLDAPHGCWALAAAGVIAAQRGLVITDLPDDLRHWLDARPRPFNPILRLLAKQTVRKILGPRSELCALWQEQEDSYSEWTSAVVKVLKAL